MRAAAIILLCLGSTALPAADTYSWVDENNERHWSDTPHSGAQKVDVMPPNGYRAPPPPAAGRSAPTATPPATPRSCTISQPTDDQVLFEADSVTISVQLAPPGAGGTVAVTLDGAGVAPSSPGGTQFTVAPIERGTHVVAAVVRDDSGRTLCSSPPVTFHVRQHSVARPR